MIRRILALGLLAVVLPTVQVHGAYGISSTVNVNVVPPPASVLPSAPKSNTPIVFQEVANGVSSESIYLNHGGTPVVAAPVVVGGFQAHPGLQPSSIAAGEAFNSYLFSFNPSSNPFYVSIIEFEHDILGVQLFGEGLRPGNVGEGYTLEGGEFALDNLTTGTVHGTTAYPEDLAGRGVESGVFMLAAQGKRLLLAGVGFDQIRVFTQGIVGNPQTAVPELSAIAGWLALSGIAMVAYRRTRKQTPELA